MTGNNTNQPLGVADLRLLMDNYQNIIQMNSIMLEQQKQVVDLQKDIIKRQEDLSRTQFKLCASFESILNKFDSSTDSLLVVNTEARNTLTKINDSMQSKFQVMDDKIDKVHIDNTKEFGKITNKIYIGMVGSGAIIMSLVTLLMIVYDKYRILTDIQKIVTNIFGKIVG